MRTAAKLASWVGCCVLLVACAAQTKLRRAELEQIAQWLPGRYDNKAQVEADRARGAPPHEALALVIVPIYVPMLSEHVFYLQEMAADDERRVLGQRLLSFELTEDEEIVQTVWTLTDPVRWRNGYLNPELFTGVMPQDIQAAEGCELKWTKDGERFRAANEAQRCRSSARGTGIAVSVDSQVELSAVGLSFSDRSFDVAGRLVEGRAGEDHFYRFTRRAST